MYTGARVRRNKKKKAWIYLILLLICIGIVEIFIILSLNTMGASEKVVQRTKTMVVESEEADIKKSVIFSIGELLKSEMEKTGFPLTLAWEEETDILQKQNTDNIHVRAKPDLEGDSLFIQLGTSGVKRSSESLDRLIQQELTSVMSNYSQDSSSGDSYVQLEKIESEEGWIPAVSVQVSSLIKAGNTEIPGEQYQGIAEGIARGINLYLRPKIMYLTFDDGPTAVNTSAVLDILKARNIKATFFVVGKNVRKNPDVARRIVEEGHAIGIHCYSHEYKDIYQSVDRFMQDFEEAYGAVLDVTGVEAKLFRFPGGSVNAYNKEISNDIIKELDARGMIYFDWNASLEDSIHQSDPETLIANAKKTSMGKDKVILLAHDIVSNTVQSLNDLIDQLSEYRMEVLTPEVKPIQFRRQE